MYSKLGFAFLKITCICISNLKVCLHSRSVFYCFLNDLLLWMHSDDLRARFLPVSVPHLFTASRSAVVWVTGIAVLLSGSLVSQTQQPVTARGILGKKTFFLFGIYNKTFQQNSLAIQCLHAWNVWCPCRSLWSHLSAE